MNSRLTMMHISRIFLFIIYNLLIIFVQTADEIHYNSYEELSSYVDPSDMSSYSHSLQKNIQKSRLLERQRSIDEINEKRTIYHGSGQDEGADNDDSISILTGIDPSSIEAEDSTITTTTLLTKNVKSKNGKIAGMGMEILERNIKFKHHPPVPGGICPTLDESAIMQYTKRIVASLLKQMNVRSHIFGPNEAITIDLRAELSFEDFKKLDAFISNTTFAKQLMNGNDADAHSLTQLAIVTDIVANLLHYVYPEPKMSYFEYLQDTITINFQYVWSPKFWINFLNLSAVAFLILLLLRRASMDISAHPIRVLFYGFLIFFIISCVIVHFDLLDNARAENHARLHQHDRVPKDCNYNEFGMRDSISYFFRVKVFGYEDMCIDYHKQTRAETRFHTTPVEAISETFSRLIFHPMEYIGGKLGKFFNGIIFEVPFWLKLPLLLLVFIFFFFGIFGYRIHSPFFSIEPAPRGQQPPRFIEGPPPPPPRPDQAGQAIIEKAPGEIIRTSTGIDVSTSTDDLEDYIRASSASNPNHHHNTNQSSIRILWNLFQDYVWIIYDIFIHFLNIILRQVPQTRELVLDEDGAFQFRNPADNNDDNSENEEEFEEPDEQLELPDYEDYQDQEAAGPHEPQFRKPNIIDPEVENVFHRRRSVHESNSSIEKIILEDTTSSASSSASSSSSSSRQRPQIIDPLHPIQSSSYGWVYVDNKNKDKE